MSLKLRNGAGGKIPTDPHCKLRKIEAVGDKGWLAGRTELSSAPCMGPKRGPDATGSEQSQGTKPQGTNASSTELSRRLGAHPRLHAPH